MAEEFGFDELGGNGGAIDLDEGSRLALAHGVDLARHDFLARAIGAGDHHPGIGRGDLGDDGADVLERRTGTDHVHPAFLALPLSEDNRLLAERLPIGGVAEGDKHAVEVEGLFDEVIGPCLQGLHRQLHGRMARHDDDRSLHAFERQGLHDFHPILARHLDITEHRVEPAVERGLQTGIAVLRLGHLVLFILQYVLQGVADELLVVDDQNAGHVANIGRAAVHRGTAFEFRPSATPSGCPHRCCTTAPLRPARLRPRCAASGTRAPRRVPARGCGQ